MNQNYIQLLQAEGNCYKKTKMLNLSNKPFFVQLKRGENMESYLRSCEKPNYEFFEQVQLPKFLQKPVTGQGAGNSLTLGQSRITPGGFR